MRFLVDYLLRPDARASGHRLFPEFTCDHVLEGVVAGRRIDDAQLRVVEVSGNRVSERVVGDTCAPVGKRPARHRQRPTNVIAFRPRHA